MKKIILDDQSYITPTWEEMGRLCFNLSKTILAKNLRFDRLIALAKGGLTWSRTLADYLGIDKLSVTQIKFYSDIGKTHKQPVILQSLPVSIDQERVLLFDDVADSGETLKLAKDYLVMCGARNVSTATLFTKTWVGTKPDFVTATTNAWIIFPHEIREMITLLSKKWHGVSHREKTKRLLTLGFPENQVNFFLNKKLKSVIE